MIMQCQYVKARFIGWLFIACPMKTIDYLDVTAFGHSVYLKRKLSGVQNFAFPLISDI